MESRKKTAKNELSELRDELQALREKFRASEEKRKSLAKQVSQLKEECRLRSGSLENTEKERLIAEHNFVESKKRIKRLENRLKVRTPRKSHRLPLVLTSTTELCPRSDQTWRGEVEEQSPALQEPNQLMRSAQGRQEDEQKYEKLSTRLRALRDLSVESSKQLQAKFSQIEEKKRLVSNVMNEIEKIREIIRTKSTVST